MKEAKGLEALNAVGIQFQDSAEIERGLTLSDPIVANQFFSTAMVMDEDMERIRRVKKGGSRALRSTRCENCQGRILL